MDKVEAAALLDDFIAEVSRLSYDELKAQIGHSVQRELNGESGACYQIECDVFWDVKPGGSLRLIASIDDGRLFTSLHPLSRDLLIAPD